MTTYNTLFITLLAAAGAATAAAAEPDSTLQQTMTLERDFTPVVRDADKLPSQPAADNSALTQRQLISFAGWTPYTLTQTDVTRLKPGQVFDYDPFDTHRGWLDFRLGNYWNADLSAGYHIIDNEATRLTVRTDWHATEQDIPTSRQALPFGGTLPDWYQSYLSGGGEVALTRRLKKLDWQLQVGYTGVEHTLSGNNLHTHALLGNGGTAVGSELRQKTSDWNARLAFSNRRQERDIEFEAGAEAYIFTYDLPEENREVQETLFADVATELDADLRAGMKAEVELRQYQKSSWLVNGLPHEGLEDGIAVRLTPFVTWDLDELHLDLGARADFLSDAKHHLGIAPAVHATYQLPSAGQWLYADVVGGVESPSVRTLMRQMPFYLPLEEHLNPFTVTDATVGYSNNRCGNLRGKLYVGAAYTLDALVAYATDGLTVGQQSLPVGVTTTLGNVDDLRLKAGAELEWTLNKYFAGKAATTVYHHSEACAGSQLANVDAEVALTSHPVRQLALELKYEGHYKRSAWYLNPATDGCEKQSMDNINDLSFSASWAFRHNLSVLADLRNLLNEEQEVWLGIPGQKFNFQVGVHWTF